MDKNYEVYRGYILVSGIMMPSYGIHEINVFESQERYKQGNPMHTSESLEEAKAWLDRHIESSENEGVQGRGEKVLEETKWWPWQEPPNEIALNLQRQPTTKHVGVEIGDITAYWVLRGAHGEPTEEYETPAIGGAEAVETLMESMNLDRTRAVMRINSLRHLKLVEFWPSPSQIERGVW